MIIYLGTRGPIDTKDAKLIVWPVDEVTVEKGKVKTKEVLRFAISYKGNTPVCWRHVYKDAKGSVAEMAGDIKTAETRALDLDALTRLDWKEIETRKKTYPNCMAAARALQQEARKDQAAKRTHYEKKHPGIKHIEAGRDLLYNGAHSLYSRILPAVHDAGYHLENIDLKWPNPQFRMINSTTGDWDDEGPYAANKGIFTLYELAAMFGDPLCDDIQRRYINPETGEVVGVKEEMPVA